MTKIHLTDGGVTAQVVNTREQLDELLDGVNEHGRDHAVILFGDSAWLLYCTDPDGTWLVETGDPQERIIDDYYQTFDGMPLIQYPATLITEPEL